MKVLATETNMWSSGIFGGLTFSSDPMMNILIPAVAISAVVAGATIVALIFLRKRHGPVAATPVPTPAVAPAST
jgi:hypothetical protein